MNNEIHGGRVAIILGVRLLVSELISAPDEWNQQPATCQYQLQFTRKIPYLELITVSWLFVIVSPTTDRHLVDLLMS